VRLVVLSSFLAALLGVLAVRAEGESGAAESETPVTGRAVPGLDSFDRMMLAFLKKHKVPGAALAVSKDGRLVYARGFGHADVEAKEPVHPNSLMRVASVSKPITALAILLLIEQGKLRPDDRVFEIVKLKPHLAEGARLDPRLKQVTVAHLLHHTGGWDSEKSGDPMGRSVEIAKALKVKPPARPAHIIRYVTGKPLDFAPGTKYAYSNFGYCLLGRILEAVTGEPYEAHVRRAVLGPLEMKATRLGKTLLSGRAPGEVKYYDEQGRKAPAVLGPDLGRLVPTPYGAWCLEAMDAHGGWVASAPDLLRFARAFDADSPHRLLKPAGLRTAFARPEGPAGYGPKGKPLDAYYGCGWEVRPEGKKGELNTWHGGALDGCASLLVRRHDGLSWAVLFNTMSDPRGRYLGRLIDPLLHRAADQVKTWPKHDLFVKQKEAGS
jgi:N-acyl-D-amino-acid deacylase